MKKKLVIVLEIIFIIGEIVFILAPKQELKNNIDEVTYKENKIKKNNTLAYMMDDGAGHYSEITNRDSWPDIKTHTFIKAECYNGEGVKQNVDNVFSFNEDTFTATMSTDTTLYCYLYFSPAEEAISYIITKAGKQLETDSHMQSRGDILRRFQGQASEVTNNYICFETDDPAICKGNTDQYMYRIIGIDTTTDQIKVIKKESLNASYKWGAQRQTWADSTLQISLNSTLFLDNLNVNWSNIIAPHDWGYGDVPYDGAGGFQFSTNTSTAYKIEKGKWSKSINKKIALMYGSDYFASGFSINQNYEPNCMYGTGYTTSRCGGSWMSLINNDSARLSTTGEEPPSINELTMTRTDSQGAMIIRNSEALDRDYLDSSFSIRPVFYIKSGLKLSGSGTITDPFIIAGVPD